MRLLPLSSARRRHAWGHGDLCGQAGIS